MDIGTNGLINNSAPVPISEAEMTHGITTIARLEDLVSSINKSLKNPNPNDIVTQYTNFARALTATPDEELISHFLVDLDGHSLIANCFETLVLNGDDVIFADVSKADVSMIFLKVLERKPTSIEIPRHEALMESLSAVAYSENPSLKNVELSMNPNPKSSEEEEESDGEEDEVAQVVNNKVASVVNEDDEMDALEIARQVAIQVEEEVVQYRETLYSSSPEQEPQEEQQPLLPLTESKSSEENPVNPTRDEDEDHMLDLNECTENDASKSVPPPEAGTSLKQKVLEFDLNVADEDESSSEVSSERAKRLRLDLNRASDEDEIMVPVLVPVQVPVQMGEKSQSSASSSSSRRNHKRARDFDLNDDPTVASRTDEGQGSNIIDLWGNSVILGNPIPPNENAPMILHSFLSPSYQPYEMYQRDWYVQEGSTSYAIPFTENGVSTKLSLMPGDGEGLDVSMGIGSLEPSSNRENGGFWQFLPPVPDKRTKRKDQDSEHDSGFSFGSRRLT